MKKLFVIFIFLFGVNITFAADVSQFVFTSILQTVNPNQISEKMTIQAQDTSGSSTDISQTACLKLETSSNTGEFSSSNTSWSLVSVLTMSKNTANKNFYYKDSSVGNYVLTAKISFRPDTETRSCASWPTEEWDIKWTINQNILISDSTTVIEPINANTTDNIASDSPQSSSGGSVWPIEPEIFANAGADKTAIAGADISFSGKALGLEKKPLDGARYLWSFGDGATAEGQNAKHVYKYPGEYITVLNVSSGQYSASDFLYVKIIPSQLKITEANEDFIKLQNGSSVNLDISGWFLSELSEINREGNVIFKFPQTTIIKAGALLQIPAEISKIGVNKKLPSVYLFYPNGSISYIFQNVEHSVSNIVSVPKENKNQNQKPEIEPEIFATSSDLNQEANIINFSNEDDKNNSFGLNKWMMAVLGVGVFGGAGLIFVRRKGGV